MAGFIRKHTGLDLTGNEAVRQAAKAQKAAGAEAIDTQQAALEQMRADLAPFTQVGVEALPQLQSLLNPQAQADFVTQNPLFQQLAQDTAQRVFANQAARGKLGSGETGALLGQQLLPLGQQMAQQQFNNLFSLGQLGQSSAAQQGAAGINTAQTIGGLQTGLGNVQAASIGQQQANTGGLLGQGLRAGASFFGGGGLAGILGALGGK
jgi:hypothetical protein